MEEPATAGDPSRRGGRPRPSNMHPGSVTEESGGQRNAHLANLILIALIIGLSVSWWREMPERIPVHFDLSGNVDRWGSKGTMWWAFSALAIVGTGLMYGVARLSHRYPRLVNLPRKIRLMDLPPELREQVILLSQGVIYWLAVAMNLTWFLLLAAVHQAALGAPDKAAKLVLGTVGVGVALVPVVLVTFYVRLGRMTRNATDRSARQ